MSQPSDDDPLTPAERIVQDWRDKKSTLEESQLKLLAEIANAVWVMSIDIGEVLEIARAQSDDDGVRH